MSEQPQPVPLKEGYQPKANGGYQPKANPNDRGYQPSTDKPVNVGNLKPPSGDSAIQPPKSNSSSPNK